MSNPSGFDYDLLVSRLHGGLCAFQSLRAHRRQREQAAAPAPAPTVEASVTAPPRAARLVDEAADLRAAVAVEPQAFVTMGGRMVPVFDLGTGLTGPMAQAPATDMPSPPAPAVTSAPEETRPPTPTPGASTPTSSAPAALTSTLKLPAPTPPQRLGLVRASAPAPAPASAQIAQSDAPPPGPATTSEPHVADADAPASTTQARQVQDTTSAATLVALFDARAEQEALRLEKVHAEHHAILARILKEHREELRACSDAEAARASQQLEALRAHSEAEAARAAQLLREVLQEHRAELARAAHAHAEQLAQVPAQQSLPAQHETTAEADLKGALIEQATLQREVNADVAENIDALTSIVADLGQTVGLLAVAAAQADKQGRLPTRTLFVPPSRVAPAIVAPSPCVVVLPDVQPDAPPEVAPKAAANSVAPVPAAPTSSACSGPAASAGPRPTPPLADTIAVERPQRRSIRLTFAEEARAQARVSQTVDEDRDDTDLETVDDDPEPHRPLGPVTRLDRPTHEEPDDD